MCVFILQHAPIAPAAPSRNRGALPRHGKRHAAPRAAGRRTCVRRQNKKGAPRVRDAPIEDWRRPTFPQTSAVSSAMRGLTSLFGMGRGGHPLNSHQGSLLAVPQPTCVASDKLDGDIQEIRTESRRAISTARLWRHRLYTCGLSRS